MVTREQILESIKTDSFLQLCAGNSYKDQNFCSLIIELNNSNQINILSEFPINKNLTSSDYWSIKRLYSQVLPDINNPLVDLVKFVTPIFKQTKYNTTDSIFCSFVKFIEKDIDRVDELLKFGKANPDIGYAVSLALEIGMQQSFDKYFQIAIELVETYSNYTIKAQGILSLAAIDLKKHPCQVKILSIIDNIMSKFNEDIIIVNALEVLHALYLSNINNKELIIDKIRICSAKAGRISYHTLARNLYFYKENDIELISIILNELNKVSIEDKETIAVIDSASVNFFRSRTFMLFEEFLTKFLSNHDNVCITEYFPNFSENILDSKCFNERNCLITKWLLSDNLLLERARLRAIFSVNSDLETLI